MTKSENAKLYRDGAFGNHARQWLTFEDLVADKEGAHRTKEFAVRSGWPGGPFQGGLFSVSSVYFMMRRMASEQHRPVSDFYISEKVDNRFCVLNAEVMRVHHDCPQIGQLYMHYATTPQMMRDALRDAPQHAIGLKAKMIIDTLCCPRGADAVWELLDEYPGHTVEVAAFNRGVGLLGWNTVIWEVRDY